jgi:hypothetical protein
MGDTGKSGVYPVLNGDQIAEVRAYATELELPDGTPLVTEGETAPRCRWPCTAPAPSRATSPC